MLREGIVRLNIINMQKYNKKIETRHNNNMKKVNDLKNAYINKINRIKISNEKTILEKEEKITNLKKEIESLKVEKKLLEQNLKDIPKEIVKKYNEKV